MVLSTTFSGRIIQVSETLDYADAISNQVIALNTLFQSMGLDSHIYTKWADEKVANHRKEITNLRLTDRDILLYHYFGHTEHSMNILKDAYCTKILVFHNITPAKLFKKTDSIYNFCLLGREKLKQIVPLFHYFWGASDYSLSELRKLGVPAENCSIIPYEIKPLTLNTTVAREDGTWLFVGRITRSKCQVEMVKLFAELRKQHPSLAQRFYLVGGCAANDPYFVELRECIEKLGLSAYIKVTGKISDEERNRYFSAAKIYVSMSAHEGFGVPLIEAPLYGLPVAALDTSAISETMGGSLGLAGTSEQLKATIIDLLSSPARYDEALKQQRHNATRFLPLPFKRTIEDAFSKIMPERSQFKTVSIVICTYNRRDFLERCLDYLQYQSCPDFEVIVVDGPSDDGTKDFLKRYEGRVKLASNPERNLAKSRNIGIELADGDIVAFIDDDAIPFDDWVDTILKEYNSRPLTTASLGGPAYYAGTLCYQLEDLGFNSKAEAWKNIPAHEIGKNGWLRSNLGTNSTFRNDFLRETKGFDEQFDYFLDESELCYRLQSNHNKLVAYTPEALVRHEFAQSHNRVSKYNWNWFTIIKNTTYFVASYSGLKGKELRSYIDNRMKIEGVASLEGAVKSGELQAEEGGRCIGLIWDGVQQGLKDAKQFPRTRELKTPPGLFKRFAVTFLYPKINQEIKQLHICIVSKEFPPFSSRGGVGTIFYHLASELLLMGHEVTVVVPYSEEKVFTQGRFTILYVKQHPINFTGLADEGFANNLRWAINALHAVANIHKTHPIDIVESALWDFEALAYSLLPKDSRPPLVIRLVSPFKIVNKTNNWNVSELVLSQFMEAELALIGHADAVVPISESIASTIEKEYEVQRDKRWNQISCGVAYWPSFDISANYNEFTELSNIPHLELESGKMLLFIGRLEGRKGIDLLLKAAQRILEADAAAYLLIAGRDCDGWVEKAQSMVPPPLLKRVYFVGEIEDATRDKLLARAYCFLFPSRYESFGMVSLEAFVHGVPVIASRSGAMPEVIPDGKCGLLFEPESSDSLADCVVRLLKDAELQKKLSDGAFKRIRLLSSRNSAIAAVKLYSQLLGQKAKFS